MTDALVANTRPDRHLYLRHNRIATLHRKRKIRLIFLGVERDRLSDLEPVCIFEHESELFLVIATEIQIYVAVSVGAFDSISRRGQHGVERGIAGLQLKRHLPRLAVQPFRRDELERDSLTLSTRNRIDIGVAVPVFLDDPTDRLGAARIKL